MSDVNDNPDISGARQFLRDYVESNQDLIETWLSGDSRETFGSELILLSLQARKIGEAYDLSGIALASAMGLFKTVEGGYLAAQKVVEYNSALGESIPAAPFLFVSRSLARQPGSCFCSASLSRPLGPKTPFQTDPDIAFCYHFSHPDNEVLLYRKKLIKHMR